MRASQTRPSGKLADVASCTRICNRASSISPKWESCKADGMPNFLDIYSAYSPASHRENDAKLCFATHHSRVGLAHFFQWIGFNHGTHAGLFGEVECVLG